MYVIYYTTNNDLWLQQECAIEYFEIVWHAFEQTAFAAVQWCLCCVLVGVIKREIIQPPGICIHAIGDLSP